MNYRRYIIEFGTGADLHGLDVTKASQKAIKDAISHGCLCGVRELLNVEDPGKAMHIQVKIGAPIPQEVRIQELKNLIPFGAPEFEVCSGGLLIDGIEEKKFGEGDQIVIVNASLTVWIDMDQVRTGDAEIEN